MNNFEYLGRLTIGQYLPADSFLHRLDPRARILVFIFPLLLIIFEPKLSGLLAGLLMVLVGLFLGRIPLRYALRGLLPPLPFLLFLAMLQIFVVRGATTSLVLIRYGPIIITTAGLLAALALIIRFSGLILGISLATFCLSTSHLVHGLEGLLVPLHRIGIPVRDFIMMIQISMRFLPILAQTAERIAKAQAARGAEWGIGRGSLFERARQVIPLIIPLFISSLHNAENLALAMDARAYNSNPQPTSMVELKFRFVDGLSIAVCAILCLLVLIAT